MMDAVHHRRLADVNSNLDGWLLSGVSDESEGRWCSTELDSCFTCVPDGPMVEPGSGTTGTGPHSSSWAVQAYQVRLLMACMH
jgi:hypothetical protein